MVDVDSLFYTPIAETQAVEGGKISMRIDDLSKEDLLALNHNDHRRAFQNYLRGGKHSKNKLSFLLPWISPQKDDLILECGSSSGKTCVDITRKSECYCLGVDFDSEAIEISIEMRDMYFPELHDRCHFQKDNLENMTFELNFNKILMPDFTEHIPDSVFANILINIKKQLPHTHLYIYTPLRSHLFEIMKHRNFILKNTSGHINVKRKAD